jgi:hypothetical protein
VTITVKDDTETASAAVTVPKVTVEYSENPVYLCIPDNEVNEYYNYQKTVTYTIKGICNAKIAYLGINDYDTRFTYSDGSFVVKSRADSNFTLSGNAYIQVNGSNSTAELSGSTFTVYGKPVNSITHDGTVYTIKPDDTWNQWKSYGDIQYKVQVQRGWNESVTCSIYCDKCKRQYSYRYNSGTQSWESGY